MSDAAILKEFLVSLSLKSDESQQKRFLGAIEGATKGIVALGATIKTVEVAAFAMAQRVAAGFEQLAYSSSRLNSSVSSIKEFQFAISQLGGTAEGALQSLENFGRKLRESPGIEELVKSFGVRTRDARGRMMNERDMLLGVINSQKFKAYPYSTQLQYANEFGLSENTLLAMKNPDILRQLNEAREVYKRNGVDLDTLAEKGVKFEKTWRSIQLRLTASYERIATSIGDVLQPKMEEFKKWLDENSPGINEDFDTMIGWLRQIINWFDGLAKKVGALVHEHLDPLTKSLTGLNSTFSLVAAGIVASGLIGVLGKIAAALTAVALSPGIAALRGLFLAFGMVGAAGALGAAALGVGIGTATGSAGDGEDEFARQRNPGAQTKSKDVGFWGRVKRFFGVGGANARETVEGQPGGATPHAATSFTGALGVSQAEFEAMREGIAKIEHARYDQMGGSSGRFAGRYQMGAAEIRETAARLGEPTPTTQQFLNDPAMQERFFEAYTLGHHEWLMKRSPAYAALNPRMKMQVLGYAHNQGAGGAANWLATRRAGVDAFGTSGTAYSDEIQKRFNKLDSAAGSNRFEADAAARRNAFAARINAGGSIADPTPAAAGPISNYDFSRHSNLGHTLHQNTNITVNGAGDPGATARTVGGAQSRVNAELLRNLQGAAR